MVVSKLDPTLLQSNTCKQMNKVIKALMTIINNRDSGTKKSYKKDDSEELVFKEARRVVKACRIANAKIFGGAIAKKRREDEARLRGYDRYGKPVGR